MISKTCTILLVNVWQRWYYFAKKSFVAWVGRITIVTLHLNHFLNMVKILFGYSQYVSVVAVAASAALFFTWLRFCCIEWIVFGVMLPVYFFLIHYFTFIFLSLLHLPPTTLCTFLVCILYNIFAKWIEMFFIERRAVC